MLCSTTYDGNSEIRCTRPAGHNGHHTDDTFLLSDLVTWTDDAAGYEIIPRPAEEPKSSTAVTMARVCRDAFMDNAAGFTCAEAEVLAAFLSDAIGPDAGAAFMLEHKSGDDDESDLHHESAGR